MSNRKAGRQRLHLPSVDEILRSDTGLVLSARFGHQTAVSAVRRTLAQVRVNVLAEDVSLPPASSLADAALHLAQNEDAPRLRRVFNLTGTVLHTNLGRAILPDTAIEAAMQAMRHPVTLEFDLATGGRGERDDTVRSLICELTGAEDACVVNNNAAAVLLTLNTLAEGREAIVSRGELIEIGGSFRLPDIMARAGARLVEVGTTNRTHLKDYEQAIGEHTSLILKAHTSNYVIQGFTKAVPPAEISQIARLRGIPFVHDLGSGALVDLGRYGLKPEPTVLDSLEEGADLVTFSGDKMLGGPQVGIVAGRKDLIATLSRNPIKRALRADKIRLAALEATLKLYRNPDRLPETLPVLKAFLRPQAVIASAAAGLLEAIGAAVGEAYTVRIAECASQIGSGSLPLETLPSAGIAIATLERRGSGRRLDMLASAFRNLPIPVIGRLRDGELVLDLRCLEDEAAFLSQLPQLRLEPEKSARRSSEGDQ